MNNKIQFHKFSIIRSPRLPYFYFEQMNSFLSEEKFWEFAVKILHKPQILDSIFVASEVFHTQLVAAIQNPFDQKARELLPTLYKYFSRMAFRPTPFGLFSAISLVNLSYDHSKLTLSETCIPQYRLDLGTLEIINKTFLKNINILENLRFFQNTTILVKKEYINYIDFDDKSSNRRFSWSRIKRNPLIDIVLDSCKSGCSYADLNKKLTELGITDDRSKLFITQLTDIKLIIPETEPVTTNISSNNSLLKIQNITTGTSLASPIKQLATYVKQVQQQISTISDKKTLFNVDSLLENKTQNLLQADLLRNAINGTIDSKFIHTIMKELFELQPLFQTKTNTDLQHFIKEFQNKYGDREISLLDALNEDVGIGYGQHKDINNEICPLLNGLVEKRYNYDRQYINHLIQKFIDKQTLKTNGGSKILYIKETDLKTLTLKKDNDKALPLGFYLLGNLLIDKTAAKDNQRFNLLTAGGISSLPLMTRFSHLDENLQKELKRCAAAEEELAGDTILAEIVFFPMGKAGNILTRPSLFQYEIPIIGQAAVDKDHTILLSELMVSVVKGKILLRSKKLNKFVLPRLSSAHNFHYSMTVYRFLCDLQIQDNSINFGWDWGKMRTKNYLPRIVYKHLVLSRAQWRIDKNILDPLISSYDHQKIAFLTSTYGLPNSVLLVQSDNELLIDLRNEIGAKILLRELKKGDITLYENLYDSFESPITDSNGDMLTNELIIPFLGDPIGPKQSKYSTPVGNITRKFIPGSEWLYLKVYCGEKEGDNILLENIKPLLMRLRNEGLIKKWFFVRYYDPEHHLRIRFLLTENISESYSKITIYLQNGLGKLVNEGKLSRIIFDTYDRELERYGPKNIENCESLFELESDMILSIIPLVKKYGENFRWKFAMVVVNNLLSSFGYKGQKKIDLLHILKEAFYSEFERFDRVRFTTDQNYRKNKNEILHFFREAICFDEEIKSIIENYDINLTSLHRQFLKSSDYNQKPKEIVSSLAHMLVNRIFFTRQREQEMIVYHFLSKFLISEVKRLNQSFTKIPSLL